MHQAPSLTHPNRRPLVGPKGSRRSFRTPLYVACSDVVIETQKGLRLTDVCLYSCVLMAAKERLGRMANQVSVFAAAGNRWVPWRACALSALLAHAPICSRYKRIEYYEHLSNQNVMIVSWLVIVATIITESYLNTYFIVLAALTGCELGSRGQRCTPRPLLPTTEYSIVNNKRIVSMRAFPDEIAVLMCFFFFKSNSWQQQRRWSLK